MPQSGTTERSWFFLKKCAIERDEWEYFIRYSVPVVYDEKQKVNVVSPFMRDGLQAAYVPGSSLKGLIRTILFGERRDRETNETMSRIRFSDSEPIADSKLAVYQKIDISNKIKPIPFFRESIDVNETIDTYLTIEDDVISIKELERQIVQFFHHYKTKWMLGFKTTEAGAHFFEQDDPLTQTILENNAPIIVLGGGSGIAAKTIHYQQYDRETEKRELFQLLQRCSRNIYGKLDIMPRNVPMALKLTKHYEKDWWLMQGVCKISFERMER